MNSQKTRWTIIRTLLFLVVGLMNTVFIKTEDIGSWKNYVGYALLVFALIDIFLLVKSSFQKNHSKE